MRIRETIRKHPTPIALISILFWLGYEGVIQGLPMEYLVVARWVGGSLIAVAIGWLLYLILRKSSKVEEQQKTITELELRQWRMAMHAPFMIDMTDTLQKMYKQMLVIIDEKTKVAINKRITDKIMLDLAEKLGVKPLILKILRRKTSLGKLETLYLIAQIHRTVGKRKKHTIYNKQLMTYLINLGGELDKRNIGLSQDQKINLEYMALLEKLDTLRVKVANNRLDEAIDTYLLCLFGTSSFLLFNLYIGLDNYITGLPIKYRYMISETQLRKATDVQMHRLLMDVADAVLEEN